MKILASPLIEPMESRRRLDEFEIKYGLSSEDFYGRYATRNDFGIPSEEAEEWAFEWELNQQIESRTQT